MSCFNVEHSILRNLIEDEWEVEMVELQVRKAWRDFVMRRPLPVGR